MSIIKIVDEIPDITPNATNPRPLFKFVKPYISPNALPSGIGKQDYIIGDVLHHPDIKNHERPNIGAMWRKKDMLVNYKYQEATKNRIRTYETFKQDDIDDYGYLTGITPPRLWFNDEYNLDRITWIIPNALPESGNTIKYPLKNQKSGLYLAPNIPLNGKIINSPVKYDWDITEMDGKYYIHTNNLYLTYYPEKYRDVDSIKLEAKDEEKKQIWVIEQDEKTFRRKDLEKVLEYSNGEYIKQLMDETPPEERFKIYKDMQNKLPVNERLPEVMIWLRSLTNEFMESYPYYEQMDAIQYISKFISEEAEKIRKEKKGLFIIGGSLLKNMYEDEINKNPNMNKRKALEKCVNVIMDN
jgi:hypothetical protein